MLKEGESLQQVEASAETRSRPEAGARQPAGRVQAQRPRSSEAADQVKVPRTPSAPAPSATASQPATRSQVRTPAPPRTPAPTPAPSRAPAPAPDRAPVPTAPSRVPAKPAPSARQAQTQTRTRPAPSKTPPPSGRAPAKTPSQKPATPPRRPSESKRLDIQGLRAIAVLLVIAYHSGLPIRGGFIGVDVFLVISGFVITAMLIRELQKSGTIRFRNFYTRRVKRLFPALAVMTTTVAIASIFLGSSFGSQQTVAKTGLGATFFSANIVIYRAATAYFSPAAITNPLLHTWTLSVEEQVYLIFPALLLLSWMFGRKLLGASQRGAAILLGIVVAVSFPLCLLISLGATSTPSQFAFYSSLTRIWEFAIGAALALAAPSIKKLPAKTAVALGIAGMCALVLGAFAISGTMPYPGYAVLLPVFGAAALITAGFRPKGRVPRALATRPLTDIGDLSYSWYLWHWPLIVFGALLWPDKAWVLIALGFGSIVPAWLSMKFLENPIRRNRSIKGKRAFVFVGLWALIPTLACLILLGGASISWGNKAVAEMQTQVTAQHVAAKNHCDATTGTNASIDKASCTSNSAGKAPHVYLIGNSVAAMYSEALIGASQKLGSPLTLATHSGCFSGQGDPTAANPTPGGDCADNFNQIISGLAKRHPGIIVMSSTWDLGTFGGTVAQQETNKQESSWLIKNLGAAVQKLRDAGHQVVIILPSPRFFHGPQPGEFLPAPRGRDSHDPHATYWRPTDCSATSAESDPTQCGATVSETAVQDSQAITYKALNTVAARTGAVTMDLRSEYCSDGVCRTNIGDRWIFQDGIHISVAESQSLSPVFTRFLRQVIRKADAESKHKGTTKPGASVSRASTAPSSGPSPDAGASPSASP